MHMKIILAKSKWEWWEQPTEQFLQQAQADGFDASEFYLNEAKESPQQLIELHQKYGLKIIAQFLTEGRDFKEHLESVERLAEKAVRCNPILINCHPGKDYFTFEENVFLLKKMSALSRETNIPFTAETHRGRATYSLIETVKYLDAIPDLYLTADFSHWMVVHESDLSNQPENLGLAISRSRHIHARVGYEEGPQVPDPRAPEWKKQLDNHLSIWQKIIKNCKDRGMEYLTITPEFGPLNYMHTMPFSNEPVKDAWELNVAMKDILTEKLFTG